MSVSVKGYSMEIQYEWNHVERSSMSFPREDNQSGINATMWD